MRFVFVTGLSGGGKSTARKMLEDQGYFCVDNLPFAMIPIFMEMAYAGAGKMDKVALCVDARSGNDLSELEQILEDPEIEAVIIETEEINLVKYATAAAHAGKHIHMDKPGGFKLEDFEALIQLVRSKDLTLHLGYMYRYNPVISKILERVKAGEFGEIFSINGIGSILLSIQRRMVLQASSHI